MADIQHDNVFDDEGYEASRFEASDGAGRSYGKMLMKRALGDDVVYSGIWKAEPGDYSHPGGPNGETFVVISGAAVFHAEGRASIPISAGAIVSVPPNTPTGMSVSETLHKVAIVAPHGSDE